MNNFVVLNLPSSNESRIDQKEKKEKIKVDPKFIGVMHNLLFC